MGTWEVAGVAANETQHEVGLPIALANHLGHQTNEMFADPLLLTESGLALGCRLLPATAGSGAGKELGELRM